MLPCSPIFFSILSKTCFHIFHFVTHLVGEFRRIAHLLGPHIRQLYLERDDDRKCPVSQENFAGCDKNQFFKPPTIPTVPPDTRWKKSSLSRNVIYLTNLLQYDCEPPSGQFGLCFAEKNQMFKFCSRSWLIESFGFTFRCQSL